MPNDDNVMRANEVAGQIAMMELLRILIRDVYADPDPDTFQQRLARLDDEANQSLRSRTLYKQANEATEAYLKEAACNFVTRVIASIKHPS